MIFYEERDNDPCNNHDGMFDHHTPRQKCEAIRYAGSRGSPQAQGDVCNGTDMVENVGGHNLCWTHRKVIKLGRATLQDTLRGER